MYFIHVYHVFQYTRRVYILDISHFSYFILSKVLLILRFPIVHHHPPPTKKNTWLRSWILPAKLTFCRTKMVISTASAGAENCISLYIFVKACQGHNRGRRGGGVLLCPQPQMSPFHILDTQTKNIFCVSNFASSFHLKIWGKLFNEKTLPRRLK